MTRNRHFVFRESILRQTGKLRLQTMAAGCCGFSMAVCLLCAATVPAAKIVGVMAFLLLLVAVADMRAAANRINQYFV